MLNALALLNFLLALSALVVFAILTRVAKTTIRYVYGMTCALMLYVAGFYGHLFATGQPLGVEFTRTATGLMIALLLAVGVYELYRR